MVDPTAEELFDQWSRLPTQNSIQFVMGKAEALFTLRGKQGELFHGDTTKEDWIHWVDHPDLKHRCEESGSTHFGTDDPFEFMTVLAWLTEYRDG